MRFSGEPLLLRYGQGFRVQLYRTVRYQTRPGQAVDMECAERKLIRGDPLGDYIIARQVPVAVFQFHYILINKQRFQKSALNYMNYPDSYYTCYYYLTAQYPWPVPSPVQSAATSPPGGEDAEPADPKHRSDPNSAAG